MLENRSGHKPNVAVYSIVRSKGDKVAHTLLVRFCLDSGYKPIQYIDKAIPVRGKASAWDRLMGDIAKGLFYGVMLGCGVEGLLDYCEYYNTRLAVVDNPSALMAPVSSGKKVKL